MLQQKILLVILSLFLVPGQSQLWASNPKALVEKMVEAVGGKDRFYALGDVQFTYDYHALNENKRDVSQERYIFDGELSWAKYSIRQMYAFPQLEGELIQGFDGKKSWALLNGKAIHGDPQIYKMAVFVRKTNYYWFTMMFKLLDEGLIYEHLGTKQIDGNNYNLVKVAFESGVGDVQDTYILYINADSHLVDRFLFTVMDFGMAEPFMMMVEYDEVSGVKIPSKRRYVASDWEGNPKDDNWIAVNWTDIKFNNGFEKSMFTEPESISAK